MFPPPRAAALPPVPAAWPKRLVCLWCGRLRWTPAPDDRFHAGCRALVRLLAELVEPPWWRW
jgi:hypothetical protein